ncbi:LacI family transcriptional regulator [Vibrio sp. AK197]
MNKIRIIDVATHAGVSKSTVSQYLNGRFGHMSGDTKQKIESSIKELNYVPNHNARSLKADKTKTLGVIVRDVSGYNTSRVIRGIDDYCKKHGYNVLIYNSDFDAESEKQALLSLSQMRVDAIVIASSGHNAELINQLMSGGTPIVQFQLEYSETRSHIVLSDYRDAAFIATEYLIKLGHKRICFMGQDIKQDLSRRSRYQGYCDALSKHGIELEDRYVQYWNREKGFEVSPDELIQSENGPTAIFTQHLAITTDLLTELNLANINIPKQVSIIGFDEIPMVEHFKVPITTIKQNAHQIGIESAQLAIEAVLGICNGIQRLIVPSVLMERDSCSEVK